MFTKIDIPAFRERPIPLLRRPEHWEARPIVECGEALVPLSKEFSPGLRCSPQYYARGIAEALDTCFVREHVARQLEEIADALWARGLTLLIWDAWRPLAVQQSLFDGYRA